MTEVPTFGIARISEAVRAQNEQQSALNVPEKSILEAAVPVSPYPAESTQAWKKDQAERDDIQVPVLRSPSHRAVTPVSMTGIRPMMSATSMASPLTAQRQDSALTPAFIAEAEAPSGESQSSGFLAIGDMIFLTAGETDSENTSSRFVIIGDGVTHTVMECVPKKLFQIRKDLYRFRQALFRVEPARQYGIRSRLRNSDSSHPVIRVETNAPELIKKLKIQAKEEEEGDEEEFEMLSGNMVTYGERIQLRHMHSNTFLTLTSDIAQYQEGCLKVGLDKYGNEGSWVELQPESHFRQEGERVQYTDQFLIAITLDKSLYYIHKAPRNVIAGSSSVRELNGSSKSTVWKARKYISRMEIKRNPEFVSTGDSFRIVCKQNMSYVTVTDLGVERFTQIKDKIVERKEDVQDEMPMMCRVDKASVDEKPVEKRTTLYLDYAKSSENVWELERGNIFRGGVATQTETFKIKHISSGYFLAMIEQHGSGEPGSASNEQIEYQIRATSDGSRPTTIFRFVPEVGMKQVHFNSLLKIQNVSTGLYLYAKEYGGSDGQSSSGTFIEATYDAKDATRTTFYLEDEPELDSLHIHQVSVIIQKMSEFYRFLWYWGLLQKSNSEYMRNYDMAKENEAELKQQVDTMCGVLVNIIEKVLRPRQDGIRQRQETIMKSRLLELLLKLAELIAKKTQFPPSFQWSSLSESYSDHKAEYENFDLFKIRLKIWVMGPEIVAIRYLRRLASQLYKTLYRCIEDNADCCQSLSTYVRFLSDQLMTYKEEVSQVLRAVLRQPKNIFERVQTEQLKGLIDLVQPSSSSQNNMMEQALVLRILASLCLRQKSAAPNYQYFIRERLFESGRPLESGQNLIRFWNYCAKQCVELFYKDVPSKQFVIMYQLGDVALKMPDRGQIRYLIPIHELSANRDLVKYVSAILELLANLCLARNTASISTVTSDLGASFDIIFQCMQDQRVHPKLRCSWNAEHQRLEEDVREVKQEGKLSLFQQHELLTVRIGEVVAWLDQTFRNVPAPYPEETPQKVKIRFTVEVLRLANDLTSLQYASSEIFEILGGIVLLMREYRAFEVDKSNLHWCAALKLQITKTEKELGANKKNGKVDELIRDCLENIKTACVIRSNKQMVGFFQVFRQFLGQREITPEISEAFVSQVFKDQDFTRKHVDYDPSMTTIVMSKTEAEGDFRQLSPRQVAPEERAKHLEDASMDIFLLKLLFRSGGKNHERAALEIIISNFDQRTRIRQMLEGAELMVEDVFREKYKKLKVLYNRLRILLQDLENLSEIKQFKADGIKDQLDQFSDVFMLICAEARKVVDLNDPAEIRQISQRIARSVGIYGLLFRFLKTKFFWIRTGMKMPFSWNDKPGKQQECMLRIKEEDAEGVLDLYRSAVSTMYSFCYSNLDNQLLAFQKISLLLRLMDNKIGLSKLLGQAIASQRATDNVAFIIDYVFSDLLAHSSGFDTRSHDIKMLNYLIHGEEGAYFTDNQTRIFQALIKYEPFRQVYHPPSSTRELYFADFRDYKTEKVKFFTVLLGVVVKCAIQNRYVTVEARRLFPSQKLLAQLQDTTLSIKLRKAFYHYFILVFCMETHDGLKREVEINDMIEFLETAMIPDLKRVLDYLPFLYTLAYNDSYSPVSCRTNDKVWLRTTSAQLQGGSIRAMLFGGPQTEAQPIDKGAELPEDEKRAKKYWKFIIYFKPWKPQLSSGLVSLFMDLLAEIRAHNITCSKELMQQLATVGEVIRDLIAKLRELQQRHQDLNLDHLIAKLEATFELYPQNDLDINQDDEVACQREALTKLATTMQNHLRSTNSTMDQFLSQLSTHEVVTKQELIAALKNQFSKETAIYQLEVVMAAVSRTENDVFLEDFARTMKPYMENERATNTLPPKQPATNPTLSPINIELKEFLRTKYRALARENEMEELQELVGRMEATIIEPALVKGDLEEIRRLNFNLDKAFRVEKHKVYLLRMYQFIIQRFITNPTKSRAERLENMRKFVQESAITDMAAGLIYLENAPIIIIEAFKLLNVLLTNNLKETQNRLLDTIQNRIDHFKLFSFIRFCIRSCVERIEALAQDQQRRKSVYLRSNYKPVDAHARLLEASDVNKASSPLLSELVLEFLKHCSDSCHEGFQSYFRTQGEEGLTVSIDLVNELSILLVKMQKNEDLKRSVRTETNLTANYALTILINLCSGPCRENQLLIGTRRQVYGFVNFVVAEEINFLVEDNFFLELFENSVLLLTALLEGSSDSGESEIAAVSKLMLKEVNRERLVYQATKIYQQLISGREAHIYQGNAGGDIPLLSIFKMRGRPVTGSEARIIEAGYQIIILLRTLNDLHDNMKVLSTIYSDEKWVSDTQDMTEVMQMDEDDLTTQLSRRLMLEGHSFLRWGKTQFGQPSSKLSPKLAAFRFYSANISCVEVNFHEKLVKQMFHVPSLCRYLSTRSREAVITKVKRTSHQEKIDDFFNRSAQYEKEMLHRQKLARYPVVHFVFKLWEFFATVAFWLVLAVNFTILFAVYHDESRTGSWTWNDDYIVSKALVQALGFVQLVLSALILVGHLVEYYPVIIYKRSEKQKIDSPAQFFHTKWISINGTTLIQDIIERTKRKIARVVENPSVAYKAIAIFRDPSVMYHILYCIISIIAWVKFLWYPILLLDVIKRREDLVNVLKSITLNYKSLILTLILGIITIYLFTIVSINIFPELYLNEKSNPTNGDYNVAATYCTGLLECFFSTLVQGVRPGGGIGDNLMIPDFYDDKYWQLFVFDMLYFILVVIVLLNIIFGIIIDTFAELRDERKEMLYDIEHKCFICGLDKFQFEVCKVPWTNHVNMDHNVYAFLAYIIYIKQKKEEDCNGIELFVKAQIKSKEVAFFPTDSLALQKALRKEDQETQENMEKLNLQQQVNAPRS